MLAAHEAPFSKKGYKATGISEIAKWAGMAVWLFNYYDSKEAIFWISTSMRTIALVGL